MLAAIGEFERDLIKDRSAEGVARAKAHGVKFGATRKLSDEDLTKLRAAFTDPKSNRQQLARDFGISRSTLYRLCKPQDVPPGA